MFSTYSNKLIPFSRLFESYLDGHSTDPCFPADFSSALDTYSFQATGCYSTLPSLKKMDSCKRGMNPVTMIIISPQAGGLNQQPPVLKSIHY